MTNDKLTRIDSTPNDSMLLGYTITQQPDGRWTAQVTACALRVNGRIYLEAVSLGQD